MSMRRKIHLMSLIGLGWCVILIGIGMALVWGPASPPPTHTGTVSPLILPAAPEVHSAQQDSEEVHTEIDHLKKSASARDQHAATMQRELTALRSQLTQVDRGQTALAQAIDQLRKHILAARPEPPSVSKQDAAAAVSRSPEEEMADDDAQLQMQIETLEAAVHGEKPDPAWAKDAEQALYAMWQGRENPGLSLVHAECRASLCRLDLDLDGTRSAEESFHTLLHHIPWSGQSFVQVTEGEAPQVVIYLAREGYALPQVTH
jgi:hypothetical protein